MAKKGLTAMGNIDRTRASMGGPTNQELKQQLKELKTTAPFKVSIDEIFTREPFVSFLPIKQHRVEPITKDMKKNGYDSKIPIFVIIENGNYIVVDGHTRLHCAKLAELKHVWIVVIDIKVSMFDFDQKAMDKYLIDYMIKIQFFRRNAEEFEYVVMAQKFEKNPSDTRIEREQFAEKFNLKLTKAGYIITVAKYADKESIKLLETDETISVNKIYKAIQAVKKVKDTMPDIITKVAKGQISYLAAHDLIKEAEEKIIIDRINHPDRTVEALTQDSVTLPTPSETQEHAQGNPQASEGNTQSNTENRGAAPAVTTPVINNSNVQGQQTSSPASSSQEATKETTPVTPPVDNSPTATPTATPTVKEETQGDNSESGLELGSLQPSQEKLKEVFEQYKVYAERQKTQTADFVLVNLKEHFIALEKIGILDSDTVEYLLDNIDTLEE